MKRPTVVYYPAPAAALTSEDLRGTFATLHRSDPLPRALNQILSERLAAATIAVTDPRLSERAAGICAGRIAEIASLQAELAGYLAHK
jgi:hypothetical protein